MDIPLLGESAAGSPVELEGAVAVGDELAIQGKGLCGSSR
jgi:hypothetical protein